MMEYSILETVDYMTQAFESIDKIEIVYGRDNKEIVIYLNNHYCDYDVTIDDIKKLLKESEQKYLRFVR